MRFKIAACLLAVMMVGLAARPAEAAPIALHLTDGTNFVTIFDGGAGDSNPLDGVVSFNGSIGAWFLNVTTGTGGGVGPNFMTLESGNALTQSNISTLSIFFTTFDISTVFSNFTLGFEGSTVNANVTYSALFSNANALFTGTQFASLGPFSGTNFSGTTSGSISATTPYSVTQAFVINATSTDRASFNGVAELNPNQVPEPGSLALLGGGLLGLASWARRRRQRKTTL